MLRALFPSRRFGAHKFAGAIADNPDEAICLLDPKGRVSFLSEGAERLLGWSLSDLIGEDLHATIHHCRTSVSTVDSQCILQDAMFARKPFHHGDTTLTGKDGTTISAAYVVTPIVVNGKIQGSGIVFTAVSRLRQEIQALRESEEQYRCLIEATPQAMWLTDPYGYITLATARAAELLGFQHRGHMLQVNSLELFAIEDRTRAVHDKRQATRAPVTGKRYTLLKRSGQESAFQAEVDIHPAHAPDMSLVGLVYVARNIDLTMEKQSGTLEIVTAPTLEGAITSTLAACSGPADAIPLLLDTFCGNGRWDAGIYWRMDPQKALLRCHTFWKGTGLRSADFETLTRQTSCAEGIDLPGRVWKVGGPLWVEDIGADSNVQRSLTAAQEGFRTGFYFPIATGEVIHGVVELLSRTVRNPNSATIEAALRASAHVARFFERGEAEKALRHQALHDALTGLPNRVLLQERIQRAIFAARETNNPVTLFLVDLDRFKQVNDTLGHRWGDDVLQQVAEKFHAALRDSDTVARMGGDEFAILLPATTLQSAILVAEKTLEALREPFIVDGRAFNIGGSIGIAVYPDHGNNTEALIHAADMAMYKAKHLGLGFTVYRPLAREASQEFVPSSLTVTQ
ncbi:MAG: hypothetical protein NVSMB52_00240 [Chloroflexota bacterium]